MMIFGNKVDDLSVKWNLEDTLIRLGLAKEGDFKWI
jgi:hypothetical protein